MREDFDYVAMPNYQADMKESADRAVQAINFVKQRAERAEQALMMVVLALGEVRVPRDVLDIARTSKIELETWTDPSDMSVRMKARRL